MNRVVIPYTIARQLKEHIMSDPRYEVCGILAGDLDCVQQIIPIANIAHDPASCFKLDPIEFVQALKTLDMTGQRLIGIYHSHPNQNLLPSQNDIQNALQNTPDYVHLILSLKSNKLIAKAWIFNNTKLLPVPIVDHPSDFTPLRTNKSEIVLIIATAILASVGVLVIAFYLLPPAPIINS